MQSEGVKLPDRIYIVCQSVESRKWIEGIWNSQKIKVKYVKVLEIHSTSPSSLKTVNCNNFKAHLPFFPHSKSTWYYSKTSLSFQINHKKTYIIKFHAKFLNFHINLNSNDPCANKIKRKCYLQSTQRYPSQNNPSLSIKQSVKQNCC